ncbi:MAG: glycosyltransferase [Caulobacteraceae bacterium]
MIAVLVILGVLPLIVWLGLVLAHGRFWTASERDDRDVPAGPAAWPRVVAVVPARDEADVIARSIGSLLAQDYPGDLRVILVDDSSSDGTAAGAREEAVRQGRTEHLEILSGEPLPSDGPASSGPFIRACCTPSNTPQISPAHRRRHRSRPRQRRRPGVPRRGPASSCSASLMAQLHCKTFPERFLIPAFVFFFQMVYPSPGEPARPHGRRCRRGDAGGPRGAQAGGGHRRHP